MGSGEISRSKDVTADLTVKAGKARKAGPKPWEMEKYIFKEEPIDEKRSSHCDPRLELVQQIHGQHQDSDFIPYDGDHGYGHPAFGIGVTSDLNASHSTENGLGERRGYSPEVEKYYQELNDESPAFKGLMGHFDGLERGMKRIEDY
jgi:hypothetical protein